MREKSKNPFWDDLGYYVLFIIVGIVGWLLPKTGPNVMVDELFEEILLGTIALIVVKRVKKMPKAEKVVEKLVKFAIVIVTIAFVGVNVARLTIDAVNGTEQTHLENASVSKHQGPFGIISLRYYVYGENEEGKSIRFQISANDYTRLQYSDNVYVSFYANTRRVASIFGD